VNWKQWVFILLIAYGAYHHFSQRPIDIQDGASVKTLPQQTSANAATFSHKTYTLTPLESFELSARVLARETYTFDRGADLAPVDLAPVPASWCTSKHLSLNNPTATTQKSVGNAYFFSINCRYTSLNRD